MATIQKRLSKSGKPSYLIKVSLGYDDFGKQKIKSFTYKPDKDMSERQGFKEAQKQAVLFEEKCKSLELNNKRVKFQYLADEWLDLIENTHEMKQAT